MAPPPSSKANIGSRRTSSTMRNGVRRSGSGNSFAPSAANRASASLSLRPVNSNRKLASVSISVSEAGKKEKLAAPPQQRKATYETKQDSEPTKPNLLDCVEPSPRE